VTIAMRPSCLRRDAKENASDSQNLQDRVSAADWHDGQFADGCHAEPRDAEALVDARLAGAALFLSVLLQCVHDFRGSAQYLDAFSQRRVATCKHLELMARKSVGRWVSRLTVMDRQSQTLFRQPMAGNQKSAIDRGCGQSVRSTSEPIKLVAVESQDGTQEFFARAGCSHARLVRFAASGQSGCTQVPQADWPSPAIVLPDHEKYPHLIDRWPFAPSHRTARLSIAFPAAIT
jgi:hypothetical protein